MVQRQRVSLGWILFWLIVIPPIGFIWLFIEVFRSGTVYRIWENNHG